MKKYILMIIAGALALSVMIGGTLAAVNVSTKESERAASDISTRELTISVEGAETVRLEVAGKERDIIPGDVINIGRDGVKVKNDRPDNYRSYIRVSVYKVFESGEGEIGPYGHEDCIGLFLGSKDLSELKQNDRIDAGGAAWIIGSNTDEEIVMYYSKPVEGGESTAPCLDKLTVSEELGNEATGAEIYLEISADAVQAIDGVNAVSSAWGLDTELDENGNIISIDF